MRTKIRNNPSHFRFVPENLSNSGSILSGDQESFAILELIRLNLAKSNLSFMLDLLLNVSRVSSTVKFKIIESGLAMRILEILETNLDPENQSEPRQADKFEAHLLCFVRCVRILAQVDFEGRSAHLFWNFLSGLFFVVNSRLELVPSSPKDALVDALSSVIDCFCRIKNFAPFLGSFQFKTLFREIQRNEDKFEFDKRHSSRFRKSYSAFFQMMVASVDSDNQSRLFEIFGKEGGNKIQIPSQVSRCSKSFTTK